MRLIALTTCTWHGGDIGLHCLFSPPADSPRRPISGAERAGDLGKIKEADGSIQRLDAKRVRLVA